MKRVLFLASVFAVLSVATLIAASCGGDDDDMNGMAGMSDGAAPAGSIEVKLSNWAVEPAQSSVRAGSVTFWAVHEMDHMDNAPDGGATHDLQVMKKKSDGSWELMGQVQSLKMGEAKALKLNLTAGDYQLSCNVVEQINGQTIAHYAKGMFTSFKVTG